jgi:hypothetical protein
MRHDPVHALRGRSIPATALGETAIDKSLTRYRDARCRRCGIVLRTVSVAVVFAIFLSSCTADDTRVKRPAEVAAIDAAGTRAHTNASETISVDTISIEGFEDAGAFDGRSVAVVGIYALIDLNKNPNRPPVYGGRVHLELRDGRYVMLEAGDAGIRDEVEIERMRGKRVRVEGVFRAHCLAWGDGAVASIAGPCLRDVKTILPID